MLINVQCLIIDPRVKILDRLEHDGSAPMLHEMRACGRGLDDGAARREITKKDGDARLVHKRTCIGRESLRCSSFQHSRTFSLKFFPLTVSASPSKQARFEQ